MFRKVPLIVLGLVAISAALWFAFSSGSKASPDETDPKGPKKIADEWKGRSSRRIAEKKIARRDRVHREKSAGMRKKMRFSVPDNLSSAGRRLVDRIQNALDDEDFERTQSSAASALNSDEQEVRLAAVDALGWFGEKALVELTPLMADPDEEVAEAAIGHVETALQGLEDQCEAFTLSTTYLETFSVNEDAMTMLSGVMSSAAVQVIEPDDPDSPADVAKARDNRETVVDSLAVMIGKGGLLKEAALEVFTEISGEEWISEAEAVRWAKDPDNYEAPEPVEDGQSESSEETDSQGL